MADIFAEIDGAEQGTPADFLTLTAPMRAAQLPAQLPTEPSRRRRRAQLPPILIDSISQRFDLLPPSSIPAEKALLGSLMLCEGDEATWSGVDAIIDREDFFQTDHQIIFDVIGQMRFAGVPIDAVTLYDRLSAMHILEDVGGKAYIAEILGSVPDWRRAIQYAKIIKTKSVLRDGISAANDLLRAAYAPGADENAGLILTEISRVTQAASESLGATADSQTGPVLITMADVESRPVQWLWPGRIPAGRITLMVGRPGEGKSFLTTDMASRVSTGTPWPDGTECPQGSVLMIVAEDDPSDTIRPRLDAHKADCGKIKIMTMVRRRQADGTVGEFMFTLEDIANAEKAILACPDCKLVVIDPIGSFLGGGVDSDKDNKVRAVLAPVGKIAEKYGVAALVVAHRRKSNASFADDMAMGSRAFTGIARAVWHVSTDPKSKDRRLFLPGKNNLARRGTGLAFTIAGDPPEIQWERAPVDLTADEGLADENESQRPGPEPAARNSAEKFLTDLLGDDSMLVSEIRKNVTGAGLAWRTIERAATTLGVIRAKSQFSKDWSWRLTPKASTPQEYPW